MASGLHNSEFKNPLINWFDSRMPLFTMLQKEYGTFPTPRNFNYLWNFGALAMFVLVVMIVTGIMLAMQYTADTNLAFGAVERIMRDVNYGWLLRYIHMNGASMFFIVVYIHIFRGLYYGSYKRPRELLWIFGMIIYLLMMATGFLGYVLPWGQMSFWGATVITNLFSAIPLVGDSIVTWLWGGFSVDNPTLTRFFALHYLLPFVILAVVFLHIWALHITGSNNPLGIEPKGPGDTIPFHPYYTTKDMFGLTVFMIIYAAFVFFAPNYLGHPDNYIPANPLVTPAHIVPEWYYLPFYAILRSITFDIGIPFTDIVIISGKLGGVICMFGAIAVLFVLPWLDKSPVRSARFRPLYRLFFWVLVLDCIALGFAGAKPAEGMWLYVAQIGTLYYFVHFLVIIPLLPRFEKTLPLPESICSSVLKKGAVAMLALLLLMPNAQAAEDAKHPKDEQWHHEGVFGTYDRAAVQRGYQVYKEVCAACHSMSLVRFRDLMAIGLTEAEVKALAASYTIMDGPDDTGEMYERPRLPADTFPAPFANEQAARAANNGAHPKDLSLKVKASPGGEDYVYSILTGYGPAPNGETREGQYHNAYFPGGWIGMPQPLNDGQITYADGTEATVAQMAHDVTTFLAWTAEPKMEARKRMGVKVILFLLVFAGIMYAAKKRVWRDLH
ncbi:MAG: cytochrome c1 [Bdellovibrionales bacterium]